MIQFLYTFPWVLITDRAASLIRLLTSGALSPKASGTKKENSSCIWSWGTSGAIHSMANAMPLLDCQLSGGGSPITRPKVSSSGGGTWNITEIIWLNCYVIFFSVIGTIKSPSNVITQSHISICVNLDINEDGKYVFYLIFTVTSSKRNYKR